MSDGAEAVAHRYEAYFAPRLRDVLPAVLAQLLAEDTPAFVSALRVCREWSAVGIWLLWRRVGLGPLARIADASRRQRYADCIQELDVHSYGRMSMRADCAAGGAVLTGLSFPRLRRVDVSSEGGELGADGIAPFLQPQLEELFCCGRHLADPAARQRLVTQCQQLRVLYLYRIRCPLDVNGPPAIDPFWPNHSSAAAIDVYATATDDDCSRLSEVLERLPALRTLGIDPSYGACGNSALDSLASGTHLETLLYPFIDTATLRRVVHRVAQPFPALRTSVGLG